MSLSSASLNLEGGEAEPGFGDLKHFE